MFHVHVLWWLKKKKTEWITLKYIIKHVWLFLIARFIRILRFEQFDKRTKPENNVDLAVVWFELVAVNFSLFLPKTQL